MTREQKEYVTNVTYTKYGSKGRMLSLEDRNRSFDLRNFLKDGSYVRS